MENSYKCPIIYSTTVLYRSGASHYQTTASVVLWHVVAMATTCGTKWVSDPLTYKGFRGSAPQNLLEYRPNLECFSGLRNHGRLWKSLH